MPRYQFFFDIRRFVKPANAVVILYQNWPHANFYFYQTAGLAKVLIYLEFLSKRPMKQNTWDSLAMSK